MKKWIGFIVLVILLGVMGWQLKPFLPLPESTPAATPVPVRGKIPKMPPPKPVQEPESESMASAGPVETTLSEEEISAVPSAEETEPVSAEATTSGADASDAAVVTSDTNETSTNPANEAAVKPAAQPEEPVENQTMETPVVASAPDQIKSESTPATTSEPVQEQTRAADLKETEPPQTDAAAEDQEDTSQDEPAAQPQTPAPFTIQVGAYLTKEYADDKLVILKGKGYEAFIFKTMDRRERTWYAVRFGRFQTRDQAAQTLRKFKEKENMDGIISRSNAL